MWEYAGMTDDDMAYMYSQASASYGRTQRKNRRAHKKKITEFEEKLNPLRGPDHAAKRATLYQNASLGDLNSLSEPPVLHRESNVNNIALLVQLGVDVNSRDKKGNTALHEAVIYNSPTICTALLEAGADPNALNKKGFTPIMDCQDSQVARIVTSAKHCDVDLINPEGTNAARIAMRVDEPMVAGIIAQHMKRFDTETLSDAAKSYSFGAVVKALVKLPDCDLSMTNKDGFTPVQVACQSRNRENLEVLLEHPTAREFAYLSDSLKFEDAVRYGKVNTIKAILASKGKSSGWDINCRPTDVFEKSILTLAINNSRTHQDRIMNIVQLLIEAGANVNGNVSVDWAPSIPPRGQVEDPLLCAMRCNLLSVGQLLLAAGSKTSTQILKNALEMPNIQWAEMLLKSGCSADTWCAMQLGERYQPYGVVVSTAVYDTSKEIAVARMLLGRLPDMDIPLMRCPWQINKMILDAGGGRLSERNSLGQPALVALLDGYAFDSDASSIQLMLDSGCDVDSRDAQGRTALMVAVWSENVEVAKMLLAEGADPYARYQGKSIADYYSRGYTNSYSSSTLRLLPLTYTRRAPPPAYPIGSEQVATIPRTYGRGRGQRDRGGRGYRQR